MNKVGIFVRVKGVWRFEGFQPYETVHDRNRLGEIRHAIVKENDYYPSSFVFLELRDELED